VAAHRLIDNLSLYSGPFQPSPPRSFRRSYRATGSRCAMGELPRRDPRRATSSWLSRRAQADPGSTTRTNIKPETAIGRPECGNPPRTSPYAGDACVAFKPTPKPTSLSLSLSLSPPPSTSTSNLERRNEPSSSRSPMPPPEDHSSLLVPAR